MCPTGSVIVPIKGAAGIVTAIVTTSLIHTKCLRGIPLYKAKRVLLIQPRWLVVEAGFPLEMAYSGSAKANDADSRRGIEVDGCGNSIDTQVRW